MAGITDEVYWKTSSSVPFNFDYDEFSNTLSGADEQFLENTKDCVFNLTLEQSSVLPIHTLISQQGLDSILQDIKLPICFNVPLVEETIKKLLLGIPCVLDNYKTLEQKLELLDTAVETLDGNVILNVILYLEKTLHKKLMYHYLPKRRVALQHYCNYLSQRCNFNELSDVYVASKNSNMSNLFYLSCKNFSNKVLLNTDIGNFLAEHSGSIVSNYDKTVLLDLQKFSVWQMHKGMQCDSVVEQLALLWKSKLEKNQSVDDITELRSIIKVTNVQYEWLQLNVMAAMEKWHQLSQHFIKPVMLILMLFQFITVLFQNIFKKNVIKSFVNQDILITTLHKHNAPTNVLQEFLTCTSDNERSLSLGKKLQCHRFVIDKLVENRDRLGLINYKMCLSPQSEDFFYLENSLHSERRWKN